MSITEKDFLLNEYTALKNETSQRIAMRYQIISFALITAGTLFGVGFQAKDASIILFYPILAVGIFALYITNSYDTQVINWYIEDCIEERVQKDAGNPASDDVIGYQHFRSTPERKIELFSRRVGSAGARAIFLLTEVIALIIGILLTDMSRTFLPYLVGMGNTVKTFDLKENALIIFAAASIVLSIIMVIFEARDIAQRQRDREAVAAQKVETTKTTATA